MGNPENLRPQEIQKKEVYWTHQCQSCHLEGSTTFTEDGTPQQMDVYTCSEHVQPGIYGSKERKLEGDRIIVRYAPSTNDSVGEISFERTNVDIDTLRSRARNRQGKSDYTAAQIAIGKIL